MGGAALTLNNRSATVNERGWLSTWVPKRTRVPRRTSGSLALGKKRERAIQPRTARTRNVSSGTQVRDRHHALWIHQVSFARLPNMMPPACGDYDCDIGTDRCRGASALPVCLRCRAVIYDLGRHYGLPLGAAPRYAPLRYRAHTTTFVLRRV